MAGALFDTSVYVQALRGSRTPFLDLAESAPEAADWFSAVVVEELYAGARGSQKDWVGQLDRDFEAIGLRL